MALSKSTRTIGNVASHHRLANYWTNEGEIHVVGPFSGYQSDFIELSVTDTKIRARSFTDRSQNYSRFIPRTSSQGFPQNRKSTPRHNAFYRYPCLFHVLLSDDCFYRYFHRTTTSFFSWWKSKPIGFCPILTSIENIILIRCYSRVVLYLCLYRRIPV